jgi:hypothetical protein
MKNLFLIALIFAGALVHAQDDKSRPSPAATATGKAGNKTITINYSQPSVKGRKIWNDLVPFGQVWRTGANETTTVEFSDNVKVEGKDVPKGKYALFTIPNEKTWTIIINKGIKWGAFTYKQEEDVIRVDVPVAKSKSFNEKFTINVNKGVVSLLWENAQVDFKVQ